MTRDDIVKATRYLCTAYNRDMTDQLIAVMLDDYGDWDYQQFVAAAKAHRRDPDRGRFFPTLADLRRIAMGDRDEIRDVAAECFDLNPLVDGTSQWDADRETYDQRDRRKHRYIAKALADFDQDARQRQRPTLDVVGNDSALGIGKTAGEVVPLDPRRICSDPDLR